MDPLSASLGAAILLKQVQATIEYLQSAKDVPSSVVQVQESLKELEVHLHVLEEATAIIEKSSTEYPQDVKDVFGHCMAISEDLLETLRILMRSFPGETRLPTKKRFLFAIKQEDHEQIARASSDLCRSILIFRDLVIR